MTATLDKPSFKALRSLHRSRDRLPLHGTIQMQEDENCHDDRSRYVSDLPMGHDVSLEILVNGERLFFDKAKRSA